MARLEVSGPLVPHVEEIRGVLQRRGHTPLTIREAMWMVARLDGWLLREGLGCDALTAEIVDRFLGSRRARGERNFITAKWFESVFGCLRSSGAAPVLVVASPVTPDEVLIVRYGRFLADERALYPRSVKQCVVVAEQFLGSIPDGVELAGVTGRHVRSFIDAQPAGWALLTLAHMLWSLRSFLRFLFLDGLITVALADTVPLTRKYSASALPETLPLRATRALVDSCDQSTPVGLRDRAMLMLLSRLGLRAGEVTRLRLDDFVWDTGDVVVAGKGGRVDRLPLPVDVGEAIVDYLQHGRPGTGTRVVFVGVRAPHREFTSGTVCNSIVASAAKRAGLGHVRPHQLRHTVASQLLADGGSLHEIGQVLRHAAESSTALYAKVDYQRLAVIARPWPRVAS